MRFAGAQVDVDDGEVRGRGSISRADVNHFVPENKYLRPELQDPGVDIDDVPCDEFLLIGNILLHPCQPKVVFAHVACVDSKFCGKRPTSLIEFSRVPHDVHMTHVIALPRIDNATVRQNFGARHKQLSLCNSFEKCQFFRNGDVNDAANWATAGFPIYGFAVLRPLESDSKGRLTGNLAMGLFLLSLTN